MRLCKCGCGGEIKNNKWEYLRGHKKNGSAAEPATGQEIEADVEQAPDDARFELTLTMSAAQIEAVWRTLSVLQKANGLVAALQSQV